MWMGKAKKKNWFWKALGCTLPHTSREIFQCVCWIFFLTYPLRWMNAHRPYRNVIFNNKFDDGENGHWFCRSTVAETAAVAALAKRKLFRKSRLFRCNVWARVLYMRTLAHGYMNRWIDFEFHHSLVLLSFSLRIFRKNLNFFLPFYRFSHLNKFIFADKCFGRI